MCVKCSPLTKATLVDTWPGPVVRWFSAVPQGFSRPSVFPPSGEKSNTSISGCALWSYWVDVAGLACLLLKHVVATSFAIQLIAASKDD